MQYSFLNFFGGNLFVDIAHSPLGPFQTQIKKNPNLLHWLDYQSKSGKSSRHS